MGKQKVYVRDIGKSLLSDSTEISGYTKVLGGLDIPINANSVSCSGGKSVTVDVNLARLDSNGYYKEGSVQQNSVANRIYTINITLDNKVAYDKLLYKYLWQMVRSPAIFAFVCELTKYADNPNGSYTASALSENILAGEYQYVVFNNPQVSTSAEDNNIIDFSIDAVLVND
jgi:hypothetical protein